METLQKQIEEASLILIFAGEGERGTWKAYHGKDTVRALKMRLTKERCGGSRWASAWSVTGIDEYDCYRAYLLDVNDTGAYDVRYINCSIVR